ncbi:uncharacterized protein UHOD_11787 [Ustilago sp. UG-2017b]|nr:uncharacterized protein UHOD_11787 [Ustilago sp. UG-2017b]
MCVTSIAPHMSFCRVTQGPHANTYAHVHSAVPTYLGYSNATRTIKGQRVWLLELYHIIVVKDIRFSELEHPSENPPPPHVPVLSGENELLKLYSWLSSGDTSVDSDVENDTTPSLQHFSWQQEANPLDDSTGNPNPYPEWDHTMSEICDTGKIVIDMDAICADLNGQLDDATAEGGH